MSVLKHHIKQLVLNDLTATYSEQVQPILILNM